MDAPSELMLRLADPAARASLLDEDALLSLATVCYEIDPATIVGPTTAIYDRIDVAVPIISQMSASARLMRAGDALPWDVTASWDGAPPPTPGADVIWAGRLVLRAAGGTGTIEQVTTAEPDLEAAFVAALAGLPPTATPEQVRAALRRAAEDTAATPPLTDTELDAVLAAVTPHAADPRQLGRAAGGRDLVGIRLTMSQPPAPADVAPVTLPVVVAFLVADASTPPRQLLQATALARRAAMPYSLAAAPAGSPNRRTDRCVCWVLPASAFDDDGWPGATGPDPEQQRTARLAAARTWLATQGVAIITT